MIRLLLYEGNLGIVDNLCERPGADNVLQTYLHFLYQLFQKPIKLVVIKSYYEHCFINIIITIIFLLQIIIKYPNYYNNLLHIFLENIFLKRALNKEN